MASTYIFGQTICPAYYCKTDTDKAFVVAITYKGNTGGITKLLTTTVYIFHQYYTRKRNNDTSESITIAYFVSYENHKVEVRAKTDKLLSVAAPLRLHQSHAVPMSMAGT